MDLWELSFLGMMSEWEQNVRDGRLLVNRRFLLLWWLEAAPFFFLISPPISTLAVKLRLTTAQENASIPFQLPMTSFFTCNLHSRNRSHLHQKIE